MTAISNLPAKCCKYISNDVLDNPGTFCDKEAKYWYLHNEDICSYCEQHNYQCGEPIKE